VDYDIAPLETAEFSNLKALALNLRNKSIRSQNVFVKTENTFWLPIDLFLKFKAKALRFENSAVSSGAIS
jgi:hypothetical protein